MKDLFQRNSANLLCTFEIRSIIYLIYIREYIANMNNISIMYETCPMFALLMIYLFSKSRMIDRIADE
ncbi:hypothetical protein G7K_6868-t1 [Saitoella complicata NRRL Y-17804]|uniref:Uncharacterized protein n=1 Tax=Saitoella complicata (strain BCRC 22490 / CBS 7301 / JCM 7358 / NBRC 10748 / NRRL Y-17804) TaxID=698492 RepID=A0A0E9NSZ5_SAICN|nr:hypothetical protein G7K_6868-t1 [Saitoella complicata NRRL Y-17804]